MHPRIRKFSKLTDVLANRKHLGFLLLQITIGLPTFPPFALTKNATVILRLDFSQPLAFFTFWAKPFAGNFLKKEPLSSMFQISLWSNPLQSYIIRSIQDSTVVSERQRDSPEICLSFMSWLNFHSSSQPSDVLKPSNSGRLKDCLMFMGSSLGNGPFT